ncbi:39S ribosomal protein L19, mitochondrial-like [Amphibalanus amphitrite]|uniref:39S ribosomal protein L19, mitochondrial-like n=1 Tax=Amphibalanus amphitrite TaxID=1232801 RepID=UPI001C916E6E|nr:39S ribosomal protein L19, mitochondrial-like [Amphibalanus amphitrite]
MASLWLPRVSRACSAFCSNTSVRLLASSALDGAASPAAPAAAQTSDQATAAPESKQDQRTSSLPEYRFVYPEFLPNPDLRLRHRLAERLERADMLRRRTRIEIPEFYVGSVLAVTVSDPQAPGKTSRFVGICILREDHGLRATMTLRNAIDQQGVEICYPLYNPTLQKIEVLRLEKRLDEDLRYLRDCPLEYSTFAFDMEPEHAADSGEVPVNPVKVPLRPRPWTWRWERAGMKGLIVPELREDFYERAKKVSEPWHKYDLMREYRRSVPVEDQREIYAEVHEHVQSLETDQRRVRRRRVFVAPKKTS